MTQERTPAAVLYPRYETDRLILRRVTRDDAPDLYHYLQDEDVMRFFGSEPFTALEQVYDAIDWYDYSLQEKQGLRLGIALKETNKMISNLGFQQEGVLRSFAFTHGKFEDKVMYSLLKTDLT